VNCALMPALTGQKVLNRFPGVVWSGDAVAGDKTATRLRPTGPGDRDEQGSEVAIGSGSSRLPPPPWGDGGDALSMSLNLATRRARSFSFSCLQWC